MKSKRDPIVVVACLVCWIASGWSAMAQTVATYGDYARRCEKLIGKIPDINCLTQGALLPITSGSRVHAKEVLTCDRPATLRLDGNTQCVPKSRLVYVKDSKNEVEYALICRKYKDTQRPEIFNDLAMIHYNRRTGTTCWYQTPTGISTSHDGTRVWSPTNSDPTPGNSGSTKAETLWAQKWSNAGPGGTSCISCHENDPYMYSPYVAQLGSVPKSELNLDVNQPDRVNVLPFREIEKDFRNGVHYPYVNLRFVRKSKDQNNKETTVFTPNWPDPIRIKLPSSNQCAGCHTVAAIEYAQKAGQPGFGSGILGLTRFSWVDLATGQKIAPGHSAHHIWMPPTSRLGKIQDQGVDYKKSVSAAKRCLNDAKKLKLYPTGSSDRQNSLAACGWHDTSIELKAEPRLDTRWENQKLAGSLRLANESAFEARKVKIRTELRSTDGHILNQTDTASVTVGPNQSIFVPFDFSGPFAARDVGRIVAHVDRLEKAETDPDLFEGEFLERNESDNKAVKTIGALGDIIADGVYTIPGSVGLRGYLNVRYSDRFSAAGPSTVSFRITDLAGNGTGPLFERLLPLTIPNLRDGQIVPVRFYLQPKNLANIRYPIKGRLTAIADTSNMIPEINENNNEASIEFEITKPHLPPPPAPGPTGRRITEFPDFHPLLRRKYYVFSELCSYVKVTSDNPFCTGLELLPEIGFEEDPSGGPFPVPIPSPALEELLQKVRQIAVEEGVDGDLAERTTSGLEQVLSGSIPEHLPLVQFLSVTGNLLFENALPAISLDSEFPTSADMGLGWRLSTHDQLHSGHIQLLPSDLELTETGSILESVPFMWIDHSGNRPNVQLSVDLTSKEFEGLPTMFGIEGGEVVPIPSSWDPSTGIVSGDVGPEITGVGVSILR